MQKGFGKRKGKRARDAVEDGDEAASVLEGRGEK
jgi:hypothetical protein